jgi:hypothetical protein
VAFPAARLAAFPAARLSGAGFRQLSMA